MAQNNIDVLLRVLNGRRFNAEMNAAARNVRRLGAEFGTAAGASSGLSRSAAAAAGALYGINAAARAATVGTGALAATVVGLGVQFNATMESNALAFEKFAGGAAGAQKLTKELFQIAASTPFSFSDITTAERRLLAFGFNVKESTALLKTLGDTLAYTGGGTDEIYRITKAFGDIRAKGRLMQQELNQLSNVGIPIVPLLREELQLTDKQLRQIGRAGIDADVALNAINTVLNRQYGGGAIKYMQTFNGQWQRLRDNISMASGMSTEGIFGWLKDGLTAVNNMMEGNSTGAIKTMRTALEGGLKAIGGAFLFVKERGAEFLDAIKPAAPFFSNVLWPILKGLGVGIVAVVVGGWKLLIGALKVVTPILGWIGDKLEPLKPVFFALGVGLTFFAGWMVRAASYVSKLGGTVGFLGRVFLVITAPLRAVIGLIGKLFSKISGMSLADTFALGRYAIQDFVAKVPGLLSGLPGLLLDVGRRMGIALLAGLGALISAGGGFAGEIGRKIGDWLNANTPFGDKVDLGFTSFTLPRLAAGGRILEGGLAMVGERGPEIVRLPAGAEVYPTGMVPAVASRLSTPAAGQPRVARGSVRPTGGPRQGGAATTPQATQFDTVRFAVTVPVMLKERQIAEAVGEYTVKKQARR